MENLVPYPPEYYAAMTAFRDYKLLYGPIALSGVLRRHSQLVEWLKSQQRHQLQLIEHDLDFLNQND